MYRNIKYESFYTFHDNRVFDGDVLLKSSHIVYAILKKYPIPSHLSNVKIVKNKSIEEADNNLVFTGTDSNGKTQYFYGDLFVKERKENKRKVFLKTYNNICELRSRVRQTLLEGDVIDDSFLIATMILLELKTFIRLGKQISYETNQTIGIRTLHKSNLDFLPEGLRISFIGKSHVHHTFFISNENDLLISSLKRLFDQDNGSDLLFSLPSGQTVSEYKINKFLKDYDLVFKNLRTYGCNIIFIHNLAFLFQESRPKSIKKLISEAIKLAANDIGHSKAIAKGSYLIEGLTSILPKVIDRVEKSSTQDINTFITIFIQTLIEEEVHDAHKALEDSHERSKDRQARLAS